MDRTKAVEQAKALVAQMTLEEKAGQLRYESPAWGCLPITGGTKRSTA